MKSKNLIFLTSKRMILYFLSVVFRFDKWHSKVVFENSGYMEDVISLCDDIGNSLVIELGCGLGEQLIRTKATNKIGIDIDSNVIRAAKFIRANGPLFYSCDILKGKDFEQMCLRIPPEFIRCESTLIMVNWIHNLPIGDIEQLVYILRTRFNITSVIIDIINKDYKSYRFRHSSEDFLPLGNVVKNIRASDNIRRLLVLDVTGK